MEKFSQIKPFSVSRSWRDADWRSFWQVLLALAVLVTAGAALIIKVEIDSHIEQVATTQKGRLERRVATFSSRISDILSGLKLVTNSAYLQHFLDHGNPDDLENLKRDFGVFIESMQIFDQARYIDEQGMERVRVDLVGHTAKVIPNEKLQNKGTRYFFTDAVKLGKGETYISPFDLNIEGTQVEIPFKPMIRLATPLFDSSNKLRGIAIVNYLGNDLLQRLNASGDDSSYIELLNRDGYWLKNANPDMEWGFMFNRQETYGTRHPDVWRMMQESPEGQIRADGKLWTWSRIYPLGQEMRSAKGTPQAAGPSEAVISASDYYWIAVSSAPIGWYESSQHDGIALRYGLLCLVSMLAVTLGSWMIALRQGRLNVANARLEHKRLQAEIITRFQQTYIDEPEPAVLFDKLLQDIIALTGSEFGLIGDVLQDEEGRDYLKCYAFSNIAWNDDTRRFHEENKAAGFVFKNLDNLFGHVITDRVPVIANDPTHDPRRGGNPAGHPEIRAFLGVPVWYGDRLVGEIGLANRPGGYDQALLDQIQPIVEACGRIIIARWDREARHAAEQAATAARRESGAVKQRIDLLLESVGEGVCGVDLDGNIIFINPAARELLGWAEDEGVGLQLHKLTHHHHADGSEFPRTECPVYQTKLDGKPRSVAEDWYWRKDGSGFPVEYTVAAIWQEGKVVGAVNVFRDITQRKQSEQELEAYRTHLESLVKARTVELKVAKEAAEAANVAKSAFLANISHEMRTPLHQVYGMAQLIKREPLSPKQSDRITKLETASLKLTAIIDTILELTKIEAEQFDLVEELFSLEGLLDDVISIAQAKATSKQLQLISEMANVPAKLVGDATHIKKALLNYVTNAIRFTEAGKVTIRVKLAAEIGENVLIRFEVEDTGQGIAPQDLPRLFSIFEQVDNSSTRIFGGLGVGLAMTMKIAQIMGGDAGCDSKLDEGSTFWFTVRLKKG